MHSCSETGNDGTTTSELERAGELEGKKSEVSVTSPFVDWQTQQNETDHISNVMWSNNDSTVTAFTCCPSLEGHTKTRRSATSDPLGCVARENAFWCSSTKTFFVVMKQNPMFLKALESH